MEEKVHNFLNKICLIEKNILEYIENNNDDENFEHLTDIMIKEKINENKDNFKLILHLISNLSRYHLRTTNFYSKIYKILSTYSSNLQTITNFEKYIIFQNDPIILLYLFENNLLIPDKTIQKKIKEKDYFSPWHQRFKYHIYFYKEFHSKYKNSNDEYYEYYSNEEYTNKKRTGENDNFICKLIREDSLDEFIEYINKNNMKTTEKIVSDEFETNCTLKNETYIEYAAFFGSLKIFKYLYLNDENITDSIWQYAIHGNNAEIIHLLEDKLEMDPEYSLYYALLFHNYEIADYLINNYDLNEFCNSDSIQFSMMKNYNFKFLNEKFILDSNLNESLICLSKYNYIDLVKLLLSNEDINKVHFKDNYYPIHCAISNGNIEFVKFLLKFPIIEANLNAILYYTNLI